MTSQSVQRKIHCIGPIKSSICIFFHTIILFQADNAHVTPCMQVLWSDGKTKYMITTRKIMVAAKLILLNTNAMAIELHFAACACMTRYAKRTF